MKMAQNLPVALSIRTSVRARRHLRGYGQRRYRRRRLPADIEDSLFRAGDARYRLCKTFRRRSPFKPQSTREAASARIWATPLPASSLNWRISKISSSARTQCPCVSNSCCRFALWNRRPLQDAARHRLRHESVFGLQRYTQTGLPTGRRRKGVCCFPRRHKCAPRPSGHSRRRVRRDQGALAGHIFVAAGAFRAEIRGIVRTIAGARIPSPDRAFKRSFRRMFLSLNISRIALARKRVRPEAQDGYSLPLLRAYGYFPSRLMQQNALEGARLFRGVFEKRNFA